MKRKNMLFSCSYPDIFIASLGGSGLNNQVSGKKSCQKAVFLMCLFSRKQFVSKVNGWKKTKDNGEH